MIVFVIKQCNLWKRNAVKPHNFQLNLLIYAIKIYWPNKRKYCVQKLLYKIYFKTVKYKQQKGHRHKMTLIITVFWKNIKNNQF